MCELREIKRVPLLASCKKTTWCLQYLRFNSSWCASRCLQRFETQWKPTSLAGWIHFASLQGSELHQRFQFIESCFAYRRGLCMIDETLLWTDHRTNERNENNLCFQKPILVSNWYHPKGASSTRASTFLQSSLVFGKAWEGTLFSCKKPCEHVLKPALTNVWFALSMLSLLCFPFLQWLADTVDLSESEIFDVGFEAPLSFFVGWKLH